MFVIRFTPGVLFFILAPVFGALIIVVCIVHANRGIRARRARVAALEEDQLLSRRPDVYNCWLNRGTYTHAEPRLSDSKLDGLYSPQGHAWTPLTLQMTDDDKLVLVTLITMPAENKHRAEIGDQEVEFATRDTQLETRSRLPVL
ncbi:SubName: Full=Uncharacterized protein {ECO:0000313/EMBL:CCA69059.1} [Serendipita indica DSM 11827]|nr:SubName: Full=Uncharacterized protein {ECO:0000313/EMBL:CCA69059.1} [Serendipita indica DSM 11827]